MRHFPVPTLIADDFAQVEAIIQRQIASQAAIAAAVEQASASQHNTRLHAVLVLLTARLGTIESDRVLHAAAAVELIRMALSIHHQLVSAADRRNRNVFEYSDWGGNVSLMLGDYVLALSASEMALAPDPQIIEAFSQSVISNSEGELMPVQAVSPRAVAIEQYETVVAATVGALVAAACKAGMICGNGTSTEIEAVNHFGAELGLALQTMADAQDISGAAQTIHERLITLPLVFAVDVGGDIRLATLIDQQTISAADIRWAQAEIMRFGGVRAAHQYAQHAVERAITQLEVFADSPAKQALTNLAHAIVQ